MAYGQIIDKFAARGKTMVTVWDIAAGQRFTAATTQNLDVRDFVCYENTGLSGQVPESAVSELKKIARLPAGMAPVI